MPRSISRSTKPQKFFERFLDNDLEKLASELEKRYELIEQAKILGVTPVSEEDGAWKSSGSISTMKWRQYNVFQFNLPEIHNLYSAVSEMVKEACEYYELDFKKEQFMVQGWFNINHSNVGKLDWHEHGPDGAPNFHGYYAVKAEPSETHYVVWDQYKININTNNRAILSEMGHPHAMGDWKWEGPRITIAYDIIPLRGLVGDMNAEQHWIPLV
jgi:hypothetical protein